MPNGCTSQDDKIPEPGFVVGQKHGHPSALQLGPRKKPSVSYSTFILHTTDDWFSVLLKTLLFIMGATLGGLCMCSAMSRLS